MLPVRDNKANHHTYPYPIKRYIWPELKLLIRKQNDWSYNTSWNTPKKLLGKSFKNQKNRPLWHFAERPNKFLTPPYQKFVMF